MPAQHATNTSLRYDCSRRDSNVTSGMQLAIPDEESSNKRTRLTRGVWREVNCYVCHFCPVPICNVFSLLATRYFHDDTVEQNSFLCGLCTQ